MVSDPAFPVPTTVTLHHSTLRPTELTYKIIWIEMYIAVPKVEIIKIKLVHIF